MESNDWWWLKPLPNPEDKDYKREGYGTSWLWCVLWALQPFVSIVNGQLVCTREAS